MKCPCHSDLEYALCCKPYHEGIPAPTPLKLMRSRYSAYALSLVDYIAKTTDKPPNLEGIQTFCGQTKFLGLEILEVTESTLSFRATLMQEGKEISYVECSEFIKREGKWMYKSIE